MNFDKRPWLRNDRLVRDAPVSRYLRGGRCYRRAQRVEGPCAGAMGKQHEEPAGDRQILLEVKELVAIAKFTMKQDGGGEAKAGEDQRGGPGVVTA